MKVIQVVPRAFSNANGVSVCVQSMCYGLHNAGVKVSLHALDTPPDAVFPFEAVGYNRSAFPCRAIGRSQDMLRGLQNACKDADIIHTNGLWMMPTVYPEWARRGTCCKFVVQPHGALAAWSLRRSRLKKLLFGTAFQNRVLSKADMWVATAQEEAEDIRRLGYRQPIAVLPNGVDIPTGIKTDRSNRRRMFFLSRIHPKKNVAMLLRCWARIEDRFSDWDLAIVGPDKDNPYAEEMKMLAKSLSCKRVTFVGELRGKEKYDFMAASECEVLPTFSENFGMVVAESLACGTPVICSKGAPWEGLVKECCGWWIPINETILEETMCKAMDLPREELLRMGENGKAWMKREFEWPAIASKMKSAYEWLITGQAKPEFVRAE